MDWEKERAVTAALIAMPHVGSRRLNQLVNAFGSAQAVWQADIAAIQKAVPLPENVRQGWTAWCRDYDFEKAAQQRQACGVQLVVWREEAYPALLAQTYNPPSVLFYQGALPESLHLIALVGSRKATPYGKNAARFLARELSENQVYVISGGARGIDTQAHTGALEGKTPTIAVMACGLDHTYPRENKKLFQEIVANGGCLMSEYPCGVKPLPQQFPARNRIIAGLSRAVVVVEAAERSGALITSDFALEEGRDVFAVPGSIFDSSSRGTNELLKKGAAPVTEGQDILREYGWQRENVQAKENYSLDLQTEALLALIPYDRGISREELFSQADWTPSALSLALLQLTLAGLIEETLPGLYIRCARPFTSF